MKTLEQFIEWEEKVDSCFQLAAVGRDNGLKAEVVMKDGEPIMQITLPAAVRKIILGETIIKALGKENPPI